MNKQVWKGVGIGVGAVIAVLVVFYWALLGFPRPEWLDFGSEERALRAEMNEAREIANEWQARAEAAEARLGKVEYYEKKAAELDLCIEAESQRRRLPVGLRQDKRGLAEEYCPDILLDIYEAASR